ncbi:hypothetical protein CHH58_05160 [Terribacillus saccharophilus]|uniref:hypothetical protein n=1 Tax=Terribacillus saccharophilus TaxID=361277 RepID=UPI000BA54A6D|nr:hypothetical protein [Terribacillus saccharophilus]PAF38814.1 hypothetical protein CHH58_05160 [Terribacillus saccharophilus]
MKSPTTLDTKTLLSNLQTHNFTDQELYDYLSKFDSERLTDLKLRLSAYIAPVHVLTKIILATTVFTATIPAFALIGKFPIGNLSEPVQVLLLLLLMILFVLSGLFTYKIINTGSVEKTIDRIAIRDLSKQRSLDAINFILNARLEEARSNSGV